MGKSYRRRSPPPGSTYEVQVVRIDDRRYVQRRTKCGKKSCGKCAFTDWEGNPYGGHGPYWYIEVLTKKGTRSIYLGKVCDTRRWVNERNRFDWAAFNAERKAKRKALKAKGGGSKGKVKGVRARRGRGRVVGCKSNE